MNYNQIARLMGNKYVTNITNRTVTAMLKLTSSFYRYLYVSCISLHCKTHVRTSSKYGEGRERCGLDHKKHNNRNRLRVKIPPLDAGQFVQAKQMSEPLQPTGKHVSYGGRFTVTTGEQSSSTETDIPKEGYSGQDREIPPNFRVWENISKHCSPNNGSFKFKVVSYNVLAQYLLECHPYLYTVCSPKDLTWNVRASRLYNEIVALAPDILCLQEVQVSHLNTFYSKFEDIGYSGVFKQKTGHRQDGCAIYFKRSMFELQDQITVEFYQPELPILNRDNIGLIVKLLPRGYTTPIVVATTHLLYNPKRTDVRLAQMQVFLAEIDRFAFHSREEPNHVPIILTGDFNSTPDSAVIKLLDRGYVISGPFRDDSDWERIGVTDNCQHLSVYLNRQEGKNTDFNNVKIQNSDYRPSRQPPDSSTLSHDFSVLFNSGHIGHSLRLMSAYNKYKPDGSYEASTFQDYWVTVDYIYFSCCTNLFLRDRLRLPSALECEALGHLPNSVYASDHLALAAVFELTTPHVKL